MRALLLSIFIIAVVVFRAPIINGATVFEDGFESGSLGPNWSVSSTNNGRTTISTSNSAATGIRHVILDDSVNDALLSSAEVTLSLDLTYKKNVILTFKAKSLGNEPHAPPTGNFTTLRNYDGVAISTDNGSTWRSVQSLATVPTSWTSYSVMLDTSVATLGGTFGSNFRIRFSEYDESPAPIDGIALEDVSLTADEDQRIVLDAPTPVTEGTGPYDGYILLALAPATPLTVNLSTSPSGQISIPATVVVPAGQTYATFQFSTVDDSLSNLTRAVTLSATSPGITSGSINLTINDDDIPLVRLVLPAQLTEGSAVNQNNATLSIDRAATVAISFNLSASPSNELSFPSIVIIPAGQTQTSFTVNAVDDSRIDGLMNVSVSTNASSLASAIATTKTADNEASALSLTLPTTILEGGITTGTVKLSGTLTTSVVVSLSSGNESGIGVPASVVIPAGQTQATFSITSVDNAVKNLSKTVEIGATAAAFTPATQTITVRDNEAAGYVFSGLKDIVNVSSPVPLTISATDMEGNVIAGFSGSVNLGVLLPDGNVQVLNPGTAALSGSSGWTGSVTLPNVSTAPLRLKASDGAGNASLSLPFDVMRVLTLTSSDLLWDAPRNRIYASVPAVDTTVNANKVVAIDPGNLQITGSVLTSQDPGQLAITSGGENLYVALNANGTVGKITLSSLALASTFPVGTSQYFGTLYAEDLCTVAGQPDVVVLSQYRKGVSPRHDGVAAYENGVMRSTKTQDHTGSNVIEPSSDPSIFFGYNNETTEFGFRRLKLDVTGMKELEVNGTLFSNFNADMKSDGNRVFSNLGVEVDGALGKRLGTFPTTGIVRPDLAANRVYFIESPYTYSYTYDKIGAYDPTTFSLIRRLSLPSVLSSAASFIRWGTNGLAFRTATTVVLINSSQLVPSDPSTDLAVTVQAAPNPANTGLPLTYSIKVTNQGANIAKNTLLGVTLSDSQTVKSAVASSGTVIPNGLVFTLPVGDLAAGASANLTITTLPQSAGSLTCTASANSTAIDPDFSNNVGFKLVSVGFQAAIDVVNQLRLTANNLIYDPTRNLLWASIPSTVEAPLGKCIVSINPQTGLISDPIPINANPYAQSMALSPNGRYLYVGLTDVAEVHRIDLSSPSYTSLRIPLGNSQWGSANYAEDIEVLDGDGTSFIMAGNGDHAAAVFDSTTGMRSSRTGIYTVDRVERTTTSGTFVGYLNYSSGFGTTRLPVNPFGVTISQTVSNIISGYYTDIRSSGNLVLSSTGQLVDSDTLTLKSGLGLTGRPCVDSGNQRAYLVNGNSLRAYDTTNGAAAGSLTLPVNATGDWALGCVRWGLDGFAILGNDGKIYLTRWSSAIPPGIDQNSNGISDAWEVTNFGSLGISLGGDADGDGILDVFEYFFGTSPLVKSKNPIQPGLAVGEAANVMHLKFPRRVGLATGSYGYQVSANLRVWQTPSSITETVLSTETVGGVSTELIDAAITGPSSNRGFVHLVWLHP